MFILLTTAKLLAAGFLIHLVLWRIRLPRQQFLTLLIIFGVIFCAWFAAYGVRFLALSDLLHVTMAYASISVGYVVLYSAFNLDSPTLGLMLYVAEAKAAGRSREEVLAFLGKRSFVKGRLGQLLDSGLVREENARYVVIGIGSPGFRFILAYRKLYGSIPKGG